jgi:hypothetical protein
VTTLDRVRQLLPVVFRYNPGLEAGTPLRAGFVAQQVQEVFPDAVHEVDGYLVLDALKLKQYVQQALQEMRLNRAS